MIFNQQIAVESSNANYSVKLIIHYNSITDTLIKENYINVFDGEKVLETRGNNELVLTKFLQSYTARGESARTIITLDFLLLISIHLMF